VNAGAVVKRTPTLVAQTARGDDHGIASTDFKAENSIIFEFSFVNFANYTTSLVGLIVKIRRMTYKVYIESNLRLDNKISAVDLLPGNRGMGEMGN